mmetsp:Transcript_164147/g.526356  ORF Transcript_164147/g.526356 Transcript_164147/m.526356 type:complete len:223 (+) Transcript_164147:1267-1935(+)
MEPVLVTHVLFVVVHLLHQAAGVLDDLLGNLQRDGVRIVAADGHPSRFLRGPAGLPGLSVVQHLARHVLHRHLSGGLVKEVKGAANVHARPAILAHPRLVALAAPEMELTGQDHVVAPIAFRRAGACQERSVVRKLGNTLQGLAAGAIRAASGVAIIVRHLAHPAADGLLLKLSLRAGALFVRGEAVHGSLAMELPRAQWQKRFPPSRFDWRLLQVALWLKT